MKPETFCMAPWVHTYLSPQTERRLCCASREPARSFRQYIDSGDGTGEYDPQTLEEYWNDEHIRRVRRQMMAGEEPPECEVCNKKLLNTDVYRDYFWMLFRHHYDRVWETTDETGYTTMKPVSWDYRFSNLCNFKCRMCGDMLSSQWEAESRKHGRIDVNRPENAWMRPEIREQISEFQDQQIEQEFSDAVEEHRIEEVYWVGGEPLMYEQHWRYMPRIIELGDGPRVYARYNTNLSRIEYRGIHLFRDILDEIRDWQVCASLDGTGRVGEYIRTNLRYAEFLRNFRTGLEHQRAPNQMRLDFTITLPGLLELKNMFDLSRELNVMLLTKVCFTFTDDVAMSPLNVDRDTLNAVLDDALEYIEPRATWKQQPLIDTLKNLYSREVNQNPEGLKRACRKILEVERIRPDHPRMDELVQGTLLERWWNDQSRIAEH